MRRFLFRAVTLLFCALGAAAGAKAQDNDLSGFPSRNLLPNPFTFVDGTAVSGSDADWERRREEIKDLFQEHMLGNFPPKPAIDRVEVISESTDADFDSRTVRLFFGPGSKASVRVSLTVPKSFGGGKLPVLLSPSLSGPGNVALRRGYVSAGFAGNDFQDDGAALKEIYPEYDFATLPRRAWLVSVVLDYLETVPQVDMDRVAIYGYSRDGKMATIAAAFDERIDALVAGSTGVGGLVPWRLSGERGGGESIESTMRMFPDWFAPQLARFAGHEDRLPVDANLFLALIAPRAVLMEWGLNDEVANGWAQEQAYASALPVYERFGAEDRLSLLRVPGFHGSNDMQASMDFLDMVFGRSAKKWDYEPVFAWDYEAWKQGTGASIRLGRYPRHKVGEPLAKNLKDWESKKPAVTAAVKEMLGDAPAAADAPAGRKGFGARGSLGPIEQLGSAYNPGQLSPDVPGWVIARKSDSFGWNPQNGSLAASRRISFGPDNVRGDLYYPAGTPEGSRLPTVIWLHGYHYPLGYMWVYREEVHPILALVREGFAVLAFDQTGFGRRTGEYAPFYERYPQWSRLGKMVEDVSDAVTALEKEDVVDPSRISLFGYAMGGTVGLYAAALDERIDNVVSVCGFTPMRQDTPDKGMSGMTRYSHLYAMLPRLGLFEGNEDRLPYDFEDLMALTAPRGVLVVQPSMDRDADPAAVRGAVEKASSVYAWMGAEGNIELREPQDYGRMSEPVQNEAIEWLKERSGGQVRIAEDARTYTLDNGILKAVVSKESGDLVSLEYLGKETLATRMDADGRPDLDLDPPGANPNGLNRGMTDHQYGFWSHDAMGPRGTADAIARVTIDPSDNNGLRAEVSVKGIAKGRKMGTGPGARADGQFAADVEIRFAMEAGESQIYTYCVFTHPESYPATAIGEARFCAKLAPCFDWMSVDEKVDFHYPKDHYAGDKYVYTAVQSANPAFGWSSTTDSLGFYIINPSMEYMSGGPTKVEFMGHRDTNEAAAPCVLNYWRSSHYGGAVLSVEEGEAWEKVVGPFVIYVNSGGGHDELYADARRRAVREKARWPYGWVDTPAYVKASGRSVVKGRMALADALEPSGPQRGRFSGLKVGLAEPGVFWQKDAKYYQFWTDGSSDGSFILKNVRPGKYVLYAFADGILGEYAKADIEVPESSVVDLGILVWEPVRKGRQLFEIGVPNRNGSEFAMGDMFRDPKVVLKYAENFPDDVDFTAGESDWASMWPYLHVPHNENPDVKVRPFFGISGEGRATPYSVSFELDEAPLAGKTATLRLAICGTAARELVISVNGNSAGALALQQTRDGVITRHGSHGIWYETEFSFDSSLLKSGKNTLTLTMPAGSLNSGILYDYLRLELEE